jgi:hypothetical protein
MQKTFIDFAKQKAFQPITRQDLGIVTLLIILGCLWVEMVFIIIGQ